MKVSDSLAASALTMPSRSRSWMSRSSSGTTPPGRGSGATGRGVLRTVFSLATEPPRDNDSKQHVQPSKAGRQKNRTPGERAEERDGPEGHEAEAHYRNNPYRERTSGDDAGSVKQQPNAGNYRRHIGPVKNDCQQSAHNQRRRKTE